MHVPFFELRPSLPGLRESQMLGFSEVFASGQFIIGKANNDFCSAFAEANQIKHCIGTGNGYDALFISLKCLGIGVGDEVLVPAHTFIATINAIIKTGATPILVDCHIDDPVISLAHATTLITPQTKAIIVVHMHGQACDMAAVSDFSKTHRLIVLEDFAQAHGATWNNKPVGSFGEINATSFYPTKNLGALGDAGAITTNNSDLAEIATSLRNYGKNKHGEFEMVGYNSRLDELQAAVLLAKLPYLKELNKQRIDIANKYTTGLSKITAVKTPTISAPGSHVFYNYLLLAEDRDKLYSHLKTLDIHCEINNNVTPVFDYPALKSFKVDSTQFPNVNRIKSHGILLPMFPGLLENEQAYIIEQIKRFYAK